MTARPSERELLTKYGIDQDALIDMIRQKGDVEAILLAGSVTEGLGTDTSDVDVVVIGPEVGGNGIEFIASTFKSLVINTAHGTLLDIVVVTSQQARDIGDRLARAIAFIDAQARKERPRKMEQLEYGELLLLHRLGSGLPIHGGDRLGAIRERGQTARLSDYLFHRNLLTYASRRQDARAQIAAGHRVSALHMLQEAATLAGAAWLGSVRETNPHMKWRARLIEKHALELPSQEVDRVLRHFFIAMDADPQSIADGLFSAVDEMLGKVFVRRPDLAEQVIGGLENLEWQRNYG